MINSIQTFNRENLKSESFVEILVSKFHFPRSENTISNNIDENQYEITDGCYAGKNPQGKISFCLSAKGHLLIDPLSLL